MPAFYEIQFLPDGPTLLFRASSSNYYTLDDGTRLDFCTTPVWCHDCANFAHGEHIKPLEELEHSLATLTHATRDSGMPLLEYRGMTTLETDAFIQKKRESILKRIRWRKNRISPPKCTHCGSTNILLLPLDTPIPHPAGKGTIEITRTGISSAIIDRSFTPEGDATPTNDLPHFVNAPRQP